MRPKPHSGRNDTVGKPSKNLEVCSAKEEEKEEVSTVLYIIPIALM
jgi:hypothetical protein